MADANSILVKIFKLLSKESRENLIYHYQNKTPICSLDKADLITDGLGGA